MRQSQAPITETKIRWVFYTTFGSGKKGFSGKRASCTQMLRKSEICTQMLIFLKLSSGRFYEFGRNPRVQSPNA
jgi:hypothetical protein